MASWPAVMLGVLAYLGLWIAYCCGWAKGFQRGARFMKQKQIDAWAGFMRRGNRERRCDYTGPIPPKETDHGR